jgi:hypothetical protein
MNTGSDRFAEKETKINTMGSRHRAIETPPDGEVLPRLSPLDQDKIEGWRTPSELDRDQIEG